MDRVVDLLSEIKKRPGMYLGKPCPVRLQVFIQGWLLGKGTVADIGILAEFQEWIAKRFRITSSHSWADIIRFYSSSSSEAFDRFYQLFEEFEQDSEEKLRP